VQPYLSKFGQRFSSGRVVLLISSVTISLEFYWSPGFNIEGSVWGFLKQPSSSWFRVPAYM
jgi:hypothetical protein